MTTEPVRCGECLSAIYEEDQFGCVDCGETWDFESEGNRCPSCGRFGHRCIGEGVL